MSKIGDLINECHLHCIKKKRILADETKDSRELPISSLDLIWTGREVSNLIDFINNQVNGYLADRFCDEDES